jgi:S-adenosylmethionine:tRNA ribosyltransferase-isomerase
VTAETLAEHVMHEERFEVSESVAKAVNTAKSEGRRVIAVGTTSVRVLESAVQGRAGSPLPADGAHGVTRPTITPGPGRTKIFIHPPRDFKIVDALLTNFHLPCSTLLMLVSAFASPGELSGRENILAAYAEAVRERYRFFSYGDAMLLL